MTSLRPARRPHRSARSALSAGATLLALTTAITGSLASAAPTDLTAEPSLRPSDPAAPEGGCAVTQPPGATRVDSTRTTLKKLRTVRSVITTRRGPDGRWRARVKRTVSWTATARVSIADRYASADCDVDERAVQGTASRTRKVTTEVSALRRSSSRTKAIRQARSTAAAKARRDATRLVVTRASDAAFLAARQSFLDTLPAPAVSSSKPRRLTGPEVCPTRLGSRGNTEAAWRPGTTVPQFADPAAVWVCTYRFDTGKVSERQKVTGATRRALVAGLRSLRYDSMEALSKQACTADLGPRHLVAHVAADGTVTGAVVHDYGCHDVRLTADAARHAPGGVTSPGVPAGTFQPTRSFLDVVTQASGGR